MNALFMQVSQFCLEQEALSTWFKSKFMANRKNEIILLPTKSRILEQRGGLAWRDAQARSRKYNNNGKILNVTGLLMTEMEALERNKNTIVTHRHQHHQSNPSQYQSVTS